MKKHFKSWMSLALALVCISILFSCEKEDSTGSSASSNPKVDLIDPEKGASNQVLTITGNGIGGMTSVMFETDSVLVDFNPNFNTENAMIFRIPTDVIPGQQNIIFKNSKGVEVKVPFTVLGLPTITNVSNYNYNAGDNITLTGKNLADVSKVVFTGQSTALDIVSKTATTLTIKMPVTTLTSSKLNITNEAGVISTTQEFVSMANAYLIFTDDYQNGFVNASWGGGEVSSTVARSGASSFKTTYGKGNWSANGVASWNTGVTNVNYKYLSFWIKGGLIEHTIYLTSDQRPAGYGNADVTTPIVVPANVWTYFKLDLEKDKVLLWSKGPVFKQLGFWTKGPDNADETIYFDDVILIK
ncbi:IPT/TIG domain-containing protein [Arcticibacter eurypsychrophilus]|uniref:IPT/TIG domain-containing protein n=1 Tax=Arcticibacter eurypsychrophilus TaxID=1434752 RepID=UPI00084D50CE|nr:IPT/TIG domain-containing protein [Arcticibacter eurypsychrophilus]